ncbi:hypothetical protein [Paenibacillus odorifer]|uniref:Uncharacterized protein n=1 Tax=Paenibacillus odorifer TaxID=189426 RepID=A0A1R0Y6P3_9BACL|nr:hypothetical protein [Paenibacillus odorifer]OMD43007.1 hypothetical protein BSK52_05770 [Paenibacillus odorifer]
MPKIMKWEVGVCLLLLMVLVGCSEAKPTKVMEINEMTNLDGKPKGQYPPLSPVMQDIYNRSIPEEVYTVD